ncbi:LPXTG cell wall anchor domain-containing protein [Bacillus sp. 123MFChir2]|uniref:LPXTG cell wall anchor domain-containing protein n=1 Tax=Bacillus sp. 123MFChir2 TaxID=1169144 RepID=UPI000379052D|nr:LPXTG cell wall anchor domain-containing protein [Bacillus sp. 123MFChir2]
MKKKHALQAVAATSLLLQPMSAFAQTNETKTVTLEEAKETVHKKELESKQTNVSETAQKQESKSEQQQQQQQSIEQTKPVQEQKPTEQTKPVQEQGKTTAPPSQENKPTPQQTAPTKEEKLKEETNQQAQAKQTISELFPDATIANAVASELGKTPNDKVTEEELKQVTMLDITNEGTFTSLQGFHLLPNLEELNLYANNKVNKVLTKSALSIDLSSNKKLKHLAISNLGITALSLSENKDLQSLHLENNRIAALDVSKQTELTVLSAAHNGIKELHLPKQSKLQILDVANNNLTSLNLENQVALHDLFAEHNALSSIQFNSSGILRNIQLNNNALTNLPNLNTSKLLYLNIEENKLDLKNGPFAKKHIELLQQNFKPENDNEQTDFGYYFDYQFSTHSDRPDAPVVFVDMKNKKILGVSNHMEYSLDEGKTWNNFMIDGHISVEEGKIALIRYKKTDKWLESEATKLVFSQTDNTNNENGNNNNNGNKGNSNSGNNNSNNSNNENSNSGNNNSNNSNTNGTGQVKKSIVSKSLPKTGSAVETTGMAGVLALLGAWFLRRKAKREGQ